MDNVTLKMDTHQRTEVVKGKHVPGEKMYQFVLLIGPKTYTTSWFIDTPSEIKRKQAEQQELLRGGKVEVCYE